MPYPQSFNILLSNVSDPEVVGDGKVKKFSKEVSSHLVKKREAVRRKRVKQVGCKMQRQCKQRFYFLIFNLDKEKGQEGKQRNKE